MSHFTWCLLQITEALNFAVRYISELEMNIVAVERVKEYEQTTSIEVSVYSPLIKEFFGFLLVILFPIN